MDSSIESDIQTGIVAARGGNKQQARVCFIRALKRAPRNEDLWLRLSSVMPTTEQAMRCVEHLLTINPNNAQAREACEVLRIRMLLEESSLRPATTPMSTPRQRYLLGEALIEARIITQQQLEHALQEQVKLARKGKPLRLGDILLRLKVIQPSELNAALAAQIEDMPGSGDSSTTGMLGSFLVKREYVTRAQLLQALARQTEMQRRNKSVLIGDVLVQCGYISREQLNRAMIEWQQQFELLFY